MATLITEVTAELLSLARAKTYAKVSHNFEDDLIRGLITAARKIIQTKTGYAIGVQTYREVRSINGRGGISVLTSPFRPLRSCTVTLDGVEVDLSAAIIEDDLARVHLETPLYGSRLVTVWEVGTLDAPSTEADIFDAWEATVAFLYENRGADDQPPLPSSVMQTLARHRVFQV